MSFTIYQKSVNVGPFQRPSGRLCSICCIKNIQEIPVWLNDGQHERTIPDLYRSTFRFICGSRSEKNMKRAKDLFSHNGTNEQVLWQAQVV